MAVVNQLANNRQEHKLKHVHKFPVVENHGDRKELVMQDRVQQELWWTQAAGSIRTSTERLLIQDEQRKKRAALKSAYFQSRREQVHRS